MKNSTLLILATLFTLNIHAQEVDDFIFLGANYVNQSYYSLSEGEVANVDNTDWDIAIEASAFGVSVRINGQNGTNLYSYPDGDTSDWSNLDTIGITSWSQHFDSDVLWSDGAFNRGADTTNDNDYGWGIYNPITHHVVGDSLFVIELSDGSFKKIWIESMYLNDAIFRYADLDGSNEVSVTFDKSTYAGKNFGYYSIQNEEEIDREPDSDTWDIVFTKYIGLFDPVTYWPLTGVMHNNNVTTAMADGIDPYDAVYTDYEMTDSIAKIGWDWKWLNFSTLTYEIIEDRCYFIKAQDGVVWRIIFIDFIGAGNGEVDFTIEEVGFIVGVDEYETTNEFTMYPNPLSYGNLTLDLTSTSSEVFVSIVDLSGKQVYSDKYSNQGSQIQRLDLSDLKSGLYIISMESDQGKISKKLIVN